MKACKKCGSTKWHVDADIKACATFLDVEVLDNEVIIANAASDVSIYFCRIDGMCCANCGEDYDNDRLSGRWKHWEA